MDGVEPFAKVCRMVDGMWSAFQVDQKHRGRDGRFWTGARARSGSMPWFPCTQTDSILPSLLPDADRPQGGAAIGFVRMLRPSSGEPDLSK